MNQPAHLHADTRPTVWIVEAGELHEGGTIRGVYATHDDALPQFIQEARKIHDTFRIDVAERLPDGGYSVEGGCDWATLTPHPVNPGITHAAPEPDEAMPDRLGDAPRRALPA